MPKLSVIIPTYNRAEFIGEAIDSVLQQTYRDLEVIVVDDGSDDDTAAVVAARADPRLHYLRQPNAGETAARNTGIAHASGRLMGFLDSDDVMLPHNLETLVGLLDARPEVDVAYGWFYFISRDGSPLHFVHGSITGHIPAQRDCVWPSASPQPSGTCMEGRIFQQLVLDKEGTLAIGAAVIRRECVDKIGGFDPTKKHQGHWDFYLRLARAGCVYACARQVGLLIRIHSGGAHKQREAMVAAGLTVLDALFAEPCPADLPAGLREKAYRNLYVHYVDAFLTEDKIDRAVHCINQAVRYGGVLGEATRRIAADALARHALRQTELSPRASLAHQIAQVTDVQTAKYLRRTATAIISHHLAFEARLHGQRSQALNYAWQAVQSNPSFLRDRGLWRIVIEAIIGPAVFRHGNQHTH